MENLKLTIAILIWICISITTGIYAHKALAYLGANFITPGDVIACYTIPLVVYAYIAFILLISLERKKRQ